jgi:hypothetical protein
VIAVDVSARALDRLRARLDRNGRPMWKRLRRRRRLLIALLDDGVGPNGCADTSSAILTGAVQLPGTLQSALGGHLTISWLLTIVGVLPLLNDT